jgi:ubiquinone/menaquinone biosynthesis C-methylase UbiE
LPTIEDNAQQVFGGRAASYATSPTHIDPKVLARVVELSEARIDDIALDVGCGTGNTAFALASKVREVIGFDVTREMLDVAASEAVRRGFDNVTFRRGDVHELPYDEFTFDIVSCRRAAHHFSNITKALGEMRRVIKPDGRLVIDDRSVPADAFIDKCMNDLDRLHDPSHVREYSVDEWRTMLTSAGFEVTVAESYVQSRPLTSLTKDVRGPDVVEILKTIAGLDAAQADALGVRKVDGEIYSNHWYVTLAARPDQRR